MHKHQVAVALSGGVDSAVAALLLHEQGYSIAGITMQVSDHGQQALAAARQVAGHLGIDLHELDFRDAFRQQVVRDFCAAYARGETPNPCVRCNRFIKFGALAAQARELGASLFATGHYAGIAFDSDRNRFLLRRGADHQKDQSYFLYRLVQEQLATALLPLADLTKDQVRRIAAQHRLPVAERAASQDICFIPDNDYARFVLQMMPEAAAPGIIKDSSGRVIGRHCGLIHYTIGQRRGIGIAAAEPLYVVAIDRQDNALVVGPQRACLRRELVAADLNWIAIEELQEPCRVLARIRYLHAPAWAEVAPLEGGRVRVLFDDAQPAITPGQSVVFYDPEGSCVLGGGMIQ
jgi:tRNA-specific 2-thiouridylase